MIVVDNEGHTATNDNQNTAGVVLVCFVGVGGGVCMSTAVRHTCCAVAVVVDVHTAPAGIVDIVGIAAVGFAGVWAACHSM